MMLLITLGTTLLTGLVLVIGPGLGLAVLVDLFIAYLCCQVFKPTTEKLTSNFLQQLGVVAHCYHAVSQSPVRFISKLQENWQLISRLRAENAEYGKPYFFRKIWPPARTRVWELDESQVETSLALGASSEPKKTSTTNELTASPRRLEKPPGVSIAKPEAAEALEKQDRELKNEPLTQSTIIEGKFLARQVEDMIMGKIVVVASLRQVKQIATAATQLEEGSVREIIVSEKIIEQFTILTQEGPVQQAPAALPPLKASAAC